MSFSNEAQGAEKQNQEKHEITSDTQMKTTPDQQPLSLLGLATLTIIVALIIPLIVVHYFMRSATFFAHSFIVSDV